MNSPSTQPAGFLPYLVVPDVNQAITFYIQGFGAEETLRLATAAQQLVHAELALAGSVLMVGLEQPGLGLMSPQPQGTVSGTMCFYTADVDAVIAKALEAGATLEQGATDEFYGDRVGKVRDPFGHRWSIHTRREKLDPKTIAQRFQELTAVQP